MADHMQIVPLFLEKEGGLSRAATDTASKDPSPCFHRKLKGWHTNKGVTWTTFKGNASKLGYSASCKNFLSMAPDIWGKIFKQAYWNRFELDNLKSQPIADTIVWWAWGSGVGGASSQFRRYLRKKGINVTARKDIAQELDKLAQKDEQKTFDELKNERISYYERLNQPKNLKGWKNAYDRFENYAQSYIGKFEKYGAKGIVRSFAISPIKFVKRNWIPVSIATIGVIGLTILTIKLIRK